MYQKLAIFFGILTVVGNTWAEDISLSPLHPITWSVTESLGKGDERQVGVSLRAMGTPINKSYREIPLSNELVFTDPLQCCAAAIKARIELDETEWGILAAPREQRNTAGLPKAGYVPDNDKNLYNMLTYHTKDEKTPRVTDARIATYLRIGGAHVFDVEWSRVLGETAGPKASSVFMVEEFAPGQFRIAPEWMNPQENIAPLLRGIRDEDEDVRAHRESNPALTFQVPIHGLFGGSRDAFPLELLFCGGGAGRLSAFDRVLTQQQSLTEWVGQGASEAKDTDQHSARKLADLLTEDSLAMYQRQGAASRVLPLSRDEVVFVIDAGGVYFAFGREANSGVINSQYATCVEQDGMLLLANYRRETFLKKFLSDKRVWVPLAQAIQNNIENTTRN